MTLDIVSKLCQVEPFRYQATPQPVGDQGASSNQINEQQIEDYLNRLRTAMCADLEAIIEAGGGVDRFTQLVDTPSSYSGEAARQLRVNAGETGLEFFTPSSSSGLWLDMSTSEQETTRSYIDGKPIFQKTIQRAGNLPTGQVNIAHGITGLDRVVMFLGDALRSNGGRITFPFSDPTSAAFLVGLQYLDATNVRITVGTGWTGAGNVLSDLNLTIWYTKT